MDKERRKQLVGEYKKIKIMAGVVTITNTKNGKVYVRSVSDLKNIQMRICMALNAGKYMNLALQAEWKEHGADAFRFEVVEEHPAEDMLDVKWEMQKMEKAWLDRLQPYGESGYHKL